jgi:hypothetical protein
VVADGQFSECPLTFEEIHIIAETFVAVLLGIYHQRIEYPQTADVSRGTADTAPAAPKRLMPPQRTLITMDLAPGNRDVAISPSGNRPQSTDTSPPQSSLLVDADLESPVNDEAEDSGPEDTEEEPPDYEAVDYLPKGR